MVMSNRYPGRCCKCGGQVGVGQGVVDNSTGKWRLSHPEGKCVLTISTHPSGDLGLASNIDGYEFKPDASVPTESGAKCSVCGTTHGVAWIAGAGQYLCYRHQDNY